MDSIVLGEKLLSLLDHSSRVSTYKPALLLAIIDRAPESLGTESISVRSLAERVVELYWPQTRSYPTTGEVLSQNSGNQATIVRQIVEFREMTGSLSAALPSTVGREKAWERLLRGVEQTLAEYPIPRLQVPFGGFLYGFDWSWYGHGGWRVKSYRDSSQKISLNPGVAASLTSLGPLLRPFIMRWWTDKAARLNKGVEAAQSVTEFEEFMFGRDRQALDRIGESLLDLQSGNCFYCGVSIARERDIDHFIPWSISGDDGLDNMVASCRRCNGSKSATLAGPEHVEGILDRNERWTLDLDSLSNERTWPRSPERSLRIARATYLLSPDERPVWLSREGSGEIARVGKFRSRLESIFGDE